jgi:hypothetical protein
MSMYIQLIRELREQAKKGGVKGLEVLKHPTATVRGPTVPARTGSPVRHGF